MRSELITKRGILAIIAVMAIFLAVGTIELGSRAKFSDTEVATANTIIASCESLSVCATSGDGRWNSPRWVVSMYANERKATTITFANSSSEDITATLAVSPAIHDDGNLVFGFENPVIMVPGKGKASVIFWVETNQSITPGTYSTVLTVER